MIVAWAMASAASQWQAVNDALIELGYQMRVIRPGEFVGSKRGRETLYVIRCDRCSEVLLDDNLKKLALRATIHCRASLSDLWTLAENIYEQRGKK